MIWVWAKIRSFVLGIGSLLLLLAGVFGYGWWKGRKGGEAKAAADNATREVKTIKAIDHRKEVQHEVEKQVDNLPPAEPSADPPADSAAGKLRSDWSRD